MKLQNSDGGIPTFCRGWGKLPFDRSSPDLTAHAIRAWSAWRDNLPGSIVRQVQAATRKAVAFLAGSQRPDGAFVPLWFGNQHTPDQTNPLYGTTRVILALAELLTRPDQRVADILSAATAWLLDVANADGGFGGGLGAPSSIEETAWAIEALAAVAELDEPVRDNVMPALASAVAWLIENTHGGSGFEPSPVGLYFAKLWYFERLYPVIFTVSALGRARRVIHTSRRLSASTTAETQAGGGIIKPI